jgi:predicted DNA-binding protein with PD1-like motif
MKIHTFRLKPGSDLKAAIEEFVAEENIKAGFIITCVAGLEQAVPDRQDIRTYKGDYEVTSLVGTVSVNGVHLHIAISDTEGQGYGGHLKEGTIVHPTAEVVIGEDESVIYARELDEETGFPELKVTQLDT